MNVIGGSFRLAMVAAALGVVGASACTTDKNDPGAMTGSAGTTGAAGLTGAAGTTGTAGATGAAGTGTTGPVCAAPYAVPASSPGIADFDSYDGVSDLSKWSAPLGNDTAAGVYVGPFGYGDRANGAPETFGVVAGQSSKYALRIADTLAANYGGGMGTWQSACLNATAFTGISFWVKGMTPKGTATLTILMGDTTPSTAAKAGDAIGTCAGTGTQCVHPTFVFPVTDTWTKIQAPWTGFMAGNAAGTAVAPNGRNINQVQFGVDLNWTTNAAGTYVPTPAPYDLSVDTLAFY